MIPAVAKLGRKYLKALIKLNYQSAQAEQKLFHFCAQFPFVIYLNDVIGAWQFEIEAEVSERAEFDDLLRQMRRTFPELVRDYEIVEVGRELTLDYSPLYDEVASQAQPGPDMA